jgi:hypothetical protein
MGSRIGTSLVFCFSFSVSNNVLEIFTTYNTVAMVIWVVKLSKAELPQEGILFRTQFPSLGIFINKKVGFRKN